MHNFAKSQSPTLSTLSRLYKKKFLCFSQFRTNPISRASRVSRKKLFTFSRAKLFTFFVCVSTIICYNITMKDLVNLAFDKLGYPHEDENPDDIDHIIEYLSAPDTHTAQGVLDAYPVLFRDPVVMQVVALVRQYLISPPEELRTRRAPTMPPDPSLPFPSSDSSPDSSPIFGIPTSPNSPASALTDNKLFTILTSIVDGSLTSMGYDYKTHTPIIQTPTVGERMQAMKLLLEINASRGTQSGPQINILNNIPAHDTPSSTATPTSPSSTAHDAHDKEGDD